ncbi:MAG: hypothetical protein JO064_00005, partial [Actinobacteria bacterium]|nr:hypothetical protein [Actinomycetota bacterium]
MAESDRRTKDDADEQPSVALVRAIEAGGDLVGAVAGSAIGLIGGPPGVLGGAAAGVVFARTLRRVGGEI